MVKGVNTKKIMLANKNNITEAKTQAFGVHNYKRIDCTSPTVNPNQKIIHIHVKRNFDTLSKKTRDEVQPEMKQR